MNILEKIKTDLNNDRLFKIIDSKIVYQIENPDKNYGVISPMYSLMPCFFDYFNVDVLTPEMQNEAEKVIKIVDNAFGGGWEDLSEKITIEQETRTVEMISQVKLLKNILSVL